MQQFFSRPETLLRLASSTFGNHLDRHAERPSEPGFCRVHARLQLVQISDFSLWLQKTDHHRCASATIDSFIEDSERVKELRAGFSLS